MLTIPQFMVAVCNYATCTNDMDKELNSVATWSRDKSLTLTKLNKSTENIITSNVTFISTALTKLKITCNSQS